MLDPKTSTDLLIKNPQIKFPQIYLKFVKLYIIDHAIYTDADLMVSY